MRRIALSAMLLLGLLFFGTHSTPVHAEEPKTTADKPKMKIVKVRPGDSLVKLGKRHHSTYKRIFYANTKVKNPDLIYPGQKLKIPPKGMKLKSRSIAGANASKQPSTPTTRYKRASAPVVPANFSSSSNVWDRLAACESGGNWAINTGNGYYGGLQFSLSSWRGVGGSGYPHQATKAEQIRRAEMLRASGGWGHWPACSAKLGLR